MYNFDFVADRKNTLSLKFDGHSLCGKSEDLLPLWVADMDFPAPKEVANALRKLADSNIYGYSEPDDEYFDALISWFENRHGFVFSREQVVIAPGVVFALAQAVRAFTDEGDSVIIQTPVYYPFAEVIRNNGRVVVENPLAYNGGEYAIDFDDFEKKIIDNKVKLFILCSPHNPVGRVWTRGELSRLSSICARHDVRLLSDEIHCDIIFPGYKHIPFAHIDEDAIIFTAPSKTFNLAGLQCSNIIIKDDKVRRQFARECGKTGYGELSLPGLVSCTAAYKHGGEWLEALLEYLKDNTQFAEEFIRKFLPQVFLVRPEGTYLLWLDFRQSGIEAVELERFIEDKAKLWVDEGTMFGKDGAGFIRINAACPRSVLFKALQNIKDAFE